MIKEKKDMVFGFFRRWFMF